MTPYRRPDPDETGLSSAEIRIGMDEGVILSHVAMMAEHEPRYAEKALRWYGRALPWLELPDSLERARAFAPREVAA